MGMEIMIEIVGQSHWEFVGMWDMDFDGREKKIPKMVICGYAPFSCTAIEWYDGMWHLKGTEWTWDRMRNLIFDIFVLSQQQTWRLPKSH